MPEDLNIQNQQQPESSQQEQPSAIPQEQKLQQPAAPQPEQPHHKYFKELIRNPYFGIVIIIILSLFLSFNMLLFFFMISTSFRQTNKLVTVKLPEATENVKLERKDLASYIYVGSPIPSKQAQFGTDARIQLNDSFKTTADIRDFIASEREGMAEGDRDLMTVSIKADENVRMTTVWPSGILNLIVQWFVSLRRCSTSSAGIVKEFFN